MKESKNRHNAGERTGNMKESVTKFELSVSTIEKLASARKGTYAAQAWAVYEGCQAGASVRVVGAAIRAHSAWTCGNEALCAGLKAAAVVAVDSKPFVDDAARAEFIATAMEAAEKEHAAAVKEKAKEKKAEKAKAEKEEAEAKAKAEAETAKTPLSSRLTARREELLSWIDDAQKKAAALLIEIEAAEKTEKEAADKQAAEQKRKDDEVLASAKAIMAARGVTIETTPLFAAVKEVEMDNALEAQREARRARKADKKVAIPA